MILSVQTPTVPLSLQAFRCCEGITEKYNRLVTAYTSQKEPRLCIECLRPIHHRDARAYLCNFCENDIR